MIKEGNLLIKLNIEISSQFQFGQISFIKFRPSTKEGKQIYIYSITIKFIFYIRFQK